MSRLVVTEIITQPCMTTRVQCIEKWAAVADICKCLHNFNGVLQVALPENFISLSSTLPHCKIQLQDKDKIALYCGTLYGRKII